MQSPTSSRFAMPLTTLGVKKYYLGIFFKANWARAAKYCHYHGMHLASVNSEEEQNNIEEHIQSLDKLDEIMKSPFNKKILLQILAMNTSGPVVLTRLRRESMWNCFILCKISFSFIQL